MTYFLYFAFWPCIEEIVPGLFYGGNHKIRMQCFCFCLRLWLENQLGKHLFRLYNQSGLEQEAKECHAEKEEGDSSWPPDVATATLRSIGGVPQPDHMLFLISWGFSTQSCLLPWWAALYLVCCWVPLSSLAQVHFAFLDWPHLISFITSTPPKLEESQGLEFIPVPKPGRKIRELLGRKGSPL